MNHDKIISIFEEMIKIHNALGNQYKVNAFKRAIQQIKNTENLYEIKNKSGIGKRIKLKIEEIMETGKLQELEDFKKNPDIIAIQKLILLKGFGPRYINYLVKHYRIKNVKDLRKLVKDKKIKINEQQRIGLKYYEDLLYNIPRSEAEYIVDCLQKLAKKYISKGIKLTLVGSYARGKLESGDVDIVMIDKNADKKSNLINLREFLLKNGVLHDCFVIGATRFSCLIKTSKSKNARQIDILSVLPEDYHTAIFYFSSGELFNRKIRLIAKSKGMKLSERGLFKGSKKLTINSDRDIFKFLKIPYVSIENRG